MNTPSSQFGQANHYEFTAEEHRHVDRLRLVLLEVSLLMSGIGFLMLAVGYYLPGTTGWVTWVVGGLFLVLGVVYHHPLKGFKRLAETSNDISDLMIALDNLHTAFRTGTYIVGILGVLMLALIILLLI